MATTSADNYALVTALHAAEAALTEARLAAARNQARADAVPAAEAAASAARAEVNKALADGRVLSARHISALPWDCLGAIFQRLSPRDVARCEAACPSFRAAAARAATPSAVSFLGEDKAVAAADRHTMQAVLRRLRALAREPAAAVRSVKLSAAFEERSLQGDLLAAALDPTPGTTHVQLGRASGDAVRALAARRDRGFSVGAGWVHSVDVEPFTRLAVAMRIVSFGTHAEMLQELDIGDAASTLTRLDLIGQSTGRRVPHLPHVRRLVVSDDRPDGPDAVADLDWLPALDDLKFRPRSGNVSEHAVPNTFGTAGLWASLAHRLTRLNLYAAGVKNTLDLSFVSALSCLCDLRVDWHITAVASIGEDVNALGMLVVQHPEPEDVTMPPLPRLAPSVTRLATWGAARFEFDNAAPGTAPGLRVLDRRHSFGEFGIFREHVEVEDNELGSGFWGMPPPRAAAAPALQTLLLGYCHLTDVDQMERGCGVFWLFDLLYMAPSLVTVVIEHAWLVWELLIPPLPGEELPVHSTPDQVFAQMQGKLLNLRCLHIHSCTLCDESAAAVEAFFEELARRGVHVCRAPANDCVFCQLLDKEWGEW